MSASPVESISSESCTVFWDVMDYPFPEGLDPDLIYPRMKSILENIGCRGEVLIKAYVDKDTWPEKTIHGIDIVPIQGDSYARVHCMLVDMVLWAMENPATYFEPLSLMVISENIKQDTDFLKALEALEDRYYNLLLALPQHLSSTRLPTVSFECLSASLFDGVKPVDQSGTLPALKHKPKSRDKTVGFSNGLASLYGTVYTLSQIVVFWDVQGCPTEFSSVGQVLSQKRYCPDDVLISCYVDMDSNEDMWDIGPYTIDSIISVSTEGGGFAKVTKMLLDILFCAMNNDDVPQNLVLISKHSRDTKCESVIKALKRRGSNVIFEPSHKVPLINPDTIGIFESICESKMLRDMHITQGPKCRKITKKSINHALGSVAVFWVVEGCPSNPRELRSKVRSTLRRKGYNHNVLMTAFVAKEKFPPKMIDAYRNVGIDVRAIPVDDERGKNAWMLLEFLRWAGRDNGPSNYIVISKPFKDTLFDRALTRPLLEKFNVLFELPDHMFTYGSSLWSATELIGRMINSQQLKPYHKSQRLDTRKL